jgi:hypothetical protein
VTEETRDPQSNAVERATMEAPVRQRQTGQALMLVGVLLLLFDLIAVTFVPSDVRAGHIFWTIIFAADVVAAITLIVIGTMQRAKAKSRLNV